MAAAGVATVWLPVEDMARALKFYGETLGLTVTMRDDDWSEIDADGLTIGLNAREAVAPAGGGGAVITFCPDGGIDEEMARLESEGVVITGEVSDHPWGRVATFADSEGNDLQLFEPPAS